MPTTSTTQPKRKLNFVIKQFYEKTADDGSSIRLIKNFREKDGSLKKGFYEFKIKNNKHDSTRPFAYYIKAKNGLIYMSSMLTDFSGFQIEVGDTFEQIWGLPNTHKRITSVYDYARQITF